MSKHHMIYAAHKGDEIAIQGTADELADFFGVTRGTIGNCERTGRKIKKDYLIERVGWREKMYGS